MATYTCSPSSQEVKTGGSEVQSHAQLHKKFEANLGSIRPCARSQNWQVADLRFSPKRSGYKGRAAERGFLWECAVGQCAQCPLLMLGFAWANLALASVFAAGLGFTCSTLNKCRIEAASPYQLPQGGPSVRPCRHLLCLSGHPRMDTTHFCGPFYCLSKKIHFHYKARAAFLLSPPTFLPFVALLSYNWQIKILYVEGI